MEFAGVITEYDPFHNGHAAQLAALRARGATTIAVCMSAGLTQRGGVPLLPEPVRARAALLCGADLVVALPAPYACAGAEAFAAAGVALLTALGCDTLAFGAETPSAPRLLAAAGALQSGELSAALRAGLAGGAPFAAARAAAAETLLPGAAALLRSPNDILGIEYCKAILAQQSPLVPLPLPRLGAGHDAPLPGRGADGRPVASAGYLRRLAAAAENAGAGPEPLRPFVPPEAFELYCAAFARGEQSDPAAFSTALLALLRLADPAGFARVRGLSEGLENRLAAAVRQAGSAAALYDLLKTRRYSHARLRRLALDAALGVQAGSLPPLPPYLHLLGARRAALPRLKAARLPAATSLRTLADTGPAARAVAAAHARACDFSALCRVAPQPCGLAYTQKPVLL